MGEPPPTDWRLAVPEPVAPARELPGIDHDAVDIAEARAARLTYAVGFLALGVLLVLSCWRLF